ncbi:abscission/NoCut checkpoint regulator [Plutella xylostella]|uniref:abscission/NoCut checkpoint regulator n=1 Tax=Plutella xylostella TaxID=51655 RepID=UPI002033159E|nr:abscission/NoCut checkpoint regulator [Plutella xylostella]
MSCNTCGKSFSLLRKEKGCPGCGFSYCSKCLDNKVFLKKINSEAKVCVKCKQKSNSGESSQIEPPDAYYKRIGASSGSSAEHSTDQEILSRLQKLKDDKLENKTAVTTEEITERLKKIKGDVPSVSDAEIQERLARLRGTPNPVTTTNKVLLPTADRRTEQEQADDLLKQYLEQTTMDTQYKDEFDKSVDSIQSRLMKLKGSEGNPTAGVEAPNAESEDEEETIKKIINKYKAEASLEVEEAVGPYTSEELPFCEICNEDATLRCLGCKYLFCKRCYLDHRDDDDGCNRYEPYKPPKGI